MDTRHSKTALLAGATGLIGAQLMDALLASDYYREVRILVRRPLLKKHPRLTEIVFDFDHPDPGRVQADDVFCCLGTTMKKAGSKEAFFTVDYEYPMLIARLSRQNGARCFVIVTSMGADPESMFFYNRVKGEVEEDLREFDFERLHYVRPSLLLGHRQEKRLGEKTGEILMRILNPLMVGPLRKFRAIDSAKVARAMLALAQQPDKGVHIHFSDELQSY
jgi:uncharacterized protein YbjT (DUF2867 family)